MAKDYYKLLGVEKDASIDDIKKAYRKLAHKYHPDKGGGKDAEEKFKEVNEAYQVLSDPAKRSQYDQFGSASGPGGAGFNAGQGFAGGFGFDPRSGAGVNFDMSGDLGDIFETFFGGMPGGGRRRSRNRGNDIQVRLEIDFMEAVRGKEVEFNLEKNASCQTCGGTGAEDKELKKCGECDGQGTVERVQRTILGNIRQRTICPECRGKGEVPKKKCSDCGGQGIKNQIVTEKIDIPKGVEDGMTLRVRGAGEASIGGGENGDLLVNIKIKPDKFFVREGNDVLTEQVITFPQAALGDLIKIKTLDGEEEIRIEAGTPNGKKYRLTGLGIPVLGNDVRRGDQVVEIVVEVPKKMTKEEKEALVKYAELRGESYSEEGVFDKVKRKMGL